jgi:hypothetical protein
MATQEAARLTPVEEVALELIGQLPLAAVSHLLPLAIGRSRSALCADVARLVDRGLVARIDGPPHAASRRRQHVVSSLWFQAISAAVAFA